MVRSFHPNDNSLLGSQTMAYTPSSSALPELYASMSPPLQELRFPEYYQDFDDLPLIKRVKMPPGSGFPPLPPHPSSHDINAAPRKSIEDKFAQLKISVSGLSGYATEKKAASGNTTSQVSMRNPLAPPPALLISPQPPFTLHDAKLLNWMRPNEASLRDSEVSWPVRVEIASAGLRALLQSNTDLEQKLSQQCQQHTILARDHYELKATSDAQAESYKSLAWNHDKLREEHRRVLQHSKAKTDLLAEVMAELQDMKKGSIVHATDNAIGGDDWGVEGTDCNMRYGTDPEVNGNDWDLGQGQFDWSSNMKSEAGNVDDWNINANPFSASEGLA